MTKTEDLQFVIPSYTPETMPLGRLLEYLTEITEIFGDASKEMHLVKILKSSTKPVFRMTPLSAASARQQISAVRAGRGTQKQRIAYNRVRQMVRADGGRPAKLIDRTGVLINFDPSIDENQVVSVVRQQTKFDGSLIRVGGSGDYSAVLMQDLAGEIQSGFSAPRSIAKAMAAHLFDPLRVFGIGNWERLQSGKWRLGGMAVQSFEPLSEEPLSETLAQIRATSVVWPVDADARLTAERGGAV